MRRLLSVPWLIRLRCVFVARIAIVRKGARMFGCNPARWLVVIMTLLSAALGATSVRAQSSVLVVVQASDGSLCLQHGNSVWTIIPDPISDDDLAALTLVGDT